MDTEDKITLIGVGASFLVMGAGIGSWGTAVIVSIKRGEWLLGIVDAVIPPIGVVHGFGIWLGVW